MFHVKREAPGLPSVSRETFERLECLIAMVQQWSTAINLVSHRDLPRLRARHLEDSMQIVPLLPPAGSLIDLGSGAGFPGLVVAICTGRPVHLVEADQRKAAFLREAARSCGAQVSVHACRVEDAILPLAAAVSARALAPLRQLLSWTAPLLDRDGIALFHKGAQVDREIVDAAVEWNMQVQRWPSVSGPGGVILEIGRVSRRAHHSP